MNILDSIVLGLVQGLTEFIPVSSSGHLILVRDILGINGTNDLAFDAVLHLATALAIFVFFKKDIFNLIKIFLTTYIPIRANWNMSVGVNNVGQINKGYLNALILGTIPAVLVGLFLESFIESSLRHTNVVVGSLVIGSLVFLLAEYIHIKYTKVGPCKEVDEKRGFVAGLFQTLALIPGVSRSGITISGGFFMGFSRVEAVRFAFLLGFPVILGSGLKKLLDLYKIGFSGDIGLNLVIGSIVAFLSGLWAIKWLIRYLGEHKLTAFVWYRLILAILVLILF